MKCPATFGTGVIGPVTPRVVVATQTHYSMACDVKYVVSNKTYLVFIPSTYMFYTELKKTL